MKQSYYWVTLVFGMLLMGCKQTGETTEMEPVKVKVVTMEEIPLNGTDRKSVV